MPDSTLHPPRRAVKTRSSNIPSSSRAVPVRPRH